MTMILEQNNSFFPSHTPFFSQRLQILLSILIPLCLYYPLISAGFNSIDDGDITTAILNSYQNYSVTSWIHLFFHKSASNYYRPMVWASFILDQHIHLCTPSLMHIENILLHMANGILVFYICLKLIRLFGNNNFSWLPFLTAIFFVVNPVNTEAVAWIAARTDLMAGLFVFSSFLFLLYGLDKKIFLVPALLFYLSGLLSKESAIGLLPAITVFLWISCSKDIINKKQMIFVIIFFLAISGIYTAMRKPPAFIKMPGIFTKQNSLNNTSTSSDKHDISHHINGIIKKLVNSGRIFIEVTGFYLKKLFCPWPLNFIITKINKKLYLTVGLLILTFLIFVLMSWPLKKRLPLCLFSIVWTFSFFIPAMAVRYFHIAWTPLAERYVYISSFGSALFLALIISYGIIKSDWIKNITIVCSALYLSIFGYSVFARSTVWNTNLLLFRDTVKKSPDSPAAHNQYGIALWESEDYAKAKKEFKIAARLSGKDDFKYIEKANSFMAGNINSNSSGSMNWQDISEYYYNMALKVKKTKNRSTLLKNAIKTSEKEIRKTHDTKKLATIYKRQIKYFLAISKINDKAFYSYKIGQRYLVLGLKDKARSFFKISADLAPDTYYGKAARKLSIKLDKM